MKIVFCVPSLVAVFAALATMSQPAHAEWSLVGVEYEPMGSVSMAGGGGSIYDGGTTQVSVGAVTSTTSDEEPLPIAQIERKGSYVYRWFGANGPTPQNPVTANFTVGKNVFGAVAGNIWDQFAKSSSVADDISGFARTGDDLSYNKNSPSNESRTLTTSEFKVGITLGAMAGAEHQDPGSSGVMAHATASLSVTF